MKNNQKINKNLYFVLPVISILVVIVIVLAWVQPKVASILDKQRAIQSEKDKQVKLDAKIKQLDLLLQDKTELVAKLTSINVALPTQKDVPQLIIQLQKIAQESDVDIQAVQLSPGKLVNETAPASKTGPDITINISIQGNYEAVKTFLGKVFKAKRLINMESINLTSSSTSDNGALVVSLMMNAYYQPIPPKPTDPTQELPVITKEEEAVYDKLQSYTAYQNDGSFVPPTPQPSEPASSEAPETSASANPQ